MNLERLIAYHLRKGKWWQRAAKESTNAAGHYKFHSEAAAYLTEIQSFVVTTLRDVVRPK